MLRELILTEVETLMKEAISHGRSIGRASSVAVVDMGGNLRGSLRPEKGRIINIQIAEKKAWSAVVFQRPTHMVRNVMLPGAMGYGLQYTDHRICIVGGGYPLMDEEGDILGGIGVSGGTVEEDQACCLGAMRKMGFQTDFEDPFADVDLRQVDK